MARGRPLKSQIRQNIVEILYFTKEAYAYGIYPLYLKAFPKVTMRSIYYHLRKGEKLGEFKVSKVKKEKGHYSWGSVAEKTYYKLGPNARPAADLRVKEALESK